MKENISTDTSLKAMFDLKEKSLLKLREEKKIALSESESQRDYEIEIDEKIFKEKENNRELYKKLNELEKKMNILFSEDHAKREEVANLQNKIELFKNDIEHLKKNVTTLYSENLEKIFKENRPKDHLNSAKIDLKIAQLKAKIEKKGRINPLAEEEYQEIKEKNARLCKEKDDALLSIKDLYSLCNDLEQRSKITFQEVYGLVNQHFSDFISELFPNGKGRLELNEPENPLSSGVDIVVELKGKKIQKMDLFSGGEKTLIALSFIFALFLTRKTPFCVMDEVDAALDNENILRFISLIQKYSAETQFIIVSHNQNTFSIIDYVYGVSMQGGKSQIFSLKMPEPLQSA